MLKQSPETSSKDIIFNDPPQKAINLNGFVGFCKITLSCYHDVIPGLPPAVRVNS